MYTALVLDEKSRNKLISQFKDLIPPDYEIICHHMTINMGNAENGILKSSNFKLGQEESLEVISYAYDNQVMAVAVNCSVPSINKTKHITLAVNRKNGGKPVMSGQLKDWNPTSPIKLTGTIQEVK